MIRAAVCVVLALAGAACTLADVPDPGPPEDWKLGPVAPGDTLVLPANPCPDGTKTIGRSFEKDEFYEVAPERAQVDAPEALRLEIPLDAPVGRYRYLFDCMKPGAVVLELRWEVRVVKNASG